MQEPTYYGGYALVRSKTQSGGSTNSNASTARPPKPAEVSGLSRMNFFASNTDWMSSLMTSVAETRNVVTPICAVSSATPSLESQKRSKIFQSFWGKRNFYRGTPLCVSSSSPVTISSMPTSSTNATKATKVGGVSAVSSHERVSSMTVSDKEAKKLPKIPLPIGSDTWTAFTDTVRAAKSTVVATRHSLKRPVAPMAIGVTEADLEREIDLIRRGPEPLFRDLLAGSFPIEKPAYAELVYSNVNNSMLKEPMTVDGFVTLRRVQQQQQAQNHPVPPAPISVSPLLSPHTADNAEPVENLQLQQKTVDLPKMYSDEGHYVSRALLDEINMGSVSRPPSPACAQQESDTSLHFAGTRNGGGLYVPQQNSSLKENEGEMQLFDDDEDAAERIKRAINIVMSLSVPENTTTVETDACGEAKMSFEFDMEWLRALGNTQQQSSFFHGF